jgi:NCS1 family nucleobase:cation symporter-1
MHNVFPESTAMDSADFLCFCLFLLVSLPLISIPPEYYRKPFLFTAVTSTITSFSIFFWALAAAKGGGPFISESVEAITGVAPAKGAYLGISFPFISSHYWNLIVVWAIFYGISSQMGQIVAGVSLFMAVMACTK